jgi:hypothetical protein
MDMGNWRLEELGDEFWRIRIIVELALTDWM